MAHLYYCEDLGVSDLSRGALVEVIGEEARHAVRVSRLRVGEHTIVGNGNGILARGEVVRTERESFAVRIIEVREEAAPEQQLVLVQALAKGDRAERAIEQATEFGVDAIVPWQAARSVSRWDGAGGTAKSAKGAARWARIAREAAKQSLRAYLPELRDLASMQALCTLAAQADREMVVLHPRASATLSAWARHALDPNTHEVLVVVGPEGGFTDAELAQLRAAGAHELQLGRHVLRTSSAGPAALAVLNLALGRW